jgi:hypothetical protein
VAPVAGDWHVTALSVPGIGALSCPATTTCFAGDGGGQILMSTDPTGGPGTWRVVGSDPQSWIADISCSSTSSCHASDNNGHVLESPAGGRSPQPWTLVPMDADNVVWSITCPTTSTCIAGDSRGQVFNQRPTWSGPVG